MRSLAEFVENLTWEQMPEPVRQAVSDRVLDLISVAAGASEDPLVKSMADAMEHLTGSGPCHVWGYEKTYPAPVAAMLNGMLAHTLELDDVHPASKTHGSASLIPAAWACAEYLGRSGKEFLTAVVAGYEVIARVGMALGVSAHRNQGWHATATCGVFGCAAACGKLLGLNAEQLLSALGMAGTQSCGVWAFLADGSNCKVLHPGRAASNGLEAAFLAKSGMTGPEHILEAKDGGLLFAMSDGGNAEKLSQGLGTEWEILNMDMKPYPCCRSTHSAIDCALELRNLLKVDSIQNITVETYLVGYKQCAVSEGCLHPHTVLDAKFSMPYAVAAALEKGKVSMTEFTPEVVADPKMQELVEKVKVFETERFTSQYPAHWGCRMVIRTEDGKEYIQEVQDASGSVARPLTRKQAEAKAENFLKVAYPGHEQEVIAQIRSLESLEKMPVFCC